MSMEEWPDDHLDELFRKSAEEYDVPINNDDWADMSHRLDQLDQQTLFDRVSRWGGIGAVVLLLLAGLGWVMYDTKSTGARQPVVVTVTTLGREVAVRPAIRNQTAKGNGQSSEAIPGEMAPGNVPEKQTAGMADKAGKQPQATRMAVEPIGPPATMPVDHPSTEKDEPIVSRPGKASMAVLARKQPVLPGKSAETTGSALATSTQATSRSGNRWARARPVTETSALKRGSVVGNNLVNSQTVSVPETAPGTYPTPNGNTPGSRAGTQFAATDHSADGPWLPALMPAASLSGVVQQVAGSVPEPSLPEVAVSAPVQRPVPRLSRLSILLFASPDLSTVGLKNFERSGSNAGLAFQYQLTDRLSVNAAFMYSTKRYQTASDEYVLPNIQHLYVAPEEIIGVCNMIDIPLNIRYDWLLRPRGNGRPAARWFASAGLTSYFIQHEVYDFQYANPDDPRLKYQPRSWDNRTEGVPGGSFGFSNLNLSVGYEGPISHRLSWQVEPFMKVPLKTVGNFQVKLFTTGAFVGLRYRL